MCGFAGWIDWKTNINEKKDILKTMADTMQSRGPDASGIWTTNCAGFSHRRLIVIDPEGGSQPMIRTRVNSSYILAYNGELYNTPELSETLRRRGYTLTSHSDTEVLLLSFLEWGADCVKHLNGIFAFAIWSDRDQSLFLARDRMGVKPLFYTFLPDGLLFASELKALLSHPGIEPIVDTNGLCEIFLLGPARTPGCGVFKNINELRPGHTLIYNYESVNISKYWSVETKPHTDSFDSTVQKVNFLVTDAIKRQLVSDVPVCTFLSGGLDSSIISAVAAKEYLIGNKGNLHTFSIDYEENEKYFKPSKFQPNSDAPWVERVSEYLGTEHHYIYLNTTQVTDALHDALIARDVPGMVDIDSSLLLFCKEIKKHATVGLSGECADEIFGGYPWYYRDEMLNLDTFPWSNATSMRAKLLSPEVLANVDAEEYVHERYKSTLAEVPLSKDDSPHEKRMKEMFYLNLTWFMATLLDRKDRMSMSASLEVRVPFCDHHIVEYMWNVPWEMKYYQNREKGLLRHALSDILPGDVIWRKKSPYPKTHNPDYHKATKSMLMEVLDDKTSPLLQIINKGAVSEFVDTFSASHNEPWYGQLMSSAQIFAYLAQIDMWLREYNIKVVL